MREIRKDSYELDPVRCINSGQVFLWEKKGQSWYGINGNQLLKFSLKSERTDRINSHSNHIFKSEVEYDSFPELTNWYKLFFRLDDNNDEIHRTLSKDKTIFDIYSQYKGLRVIRQDPFQCLISFVCASNTNINRIRIMLRNLSKKFGKQITYDGIDFHLFPNPLELNRASINDLIACGLGYRSKYLKAIVEKINTKQIELENLKKIRYLEAKTELTKLLGIGNKTADCILLFSLEKTEAFPIDVWIYRSIVENYKWIFKELNFKFNKKITNNQYKIIQDRIVSQFGEYSGYVQQYMYYDIRELSKRKW